MIDRENVCIYLQNGHFDDFFVTKLQGFFQKTNFFLFFFAKKIKSSTKQEQHCEQRYTWAFYILLLFSIN